MNIGDVFLGLRADSTKGFEKDVVKAAERTGDKAGKTLGDRLKNALSPKNLAIGAGVGVLGAQVLNFLGDAAQAAREENAAIATLTQSIKANDEAWDGNIDAVEEVIAKRQDLAFSDDEQRESLRKLVSQTKDVNKALELQRTAMDLARLRGIDLAAASDLIGKVYGGNLGILARYGIQLEKGTTKTEALAEIQRRAAGQAEAYAKTELGQQERLQIALDNRVEDIGRKLLPALNELTQFLIDEGIPALDEFIELLDIDDTKSAAGIPVLRADRGVAERDQGGRDRRDRRAASPGERGPQVGEGHRPVIQRGPPPGERPSRSQPTSRGTRRLIGWWRRRPGPTRRSPMESRRPTAGNRRSADRRAPLRTTSTSPPTTSSRMYARRRGRWPRRCSTGSMRGSRRPRCWSRPRSARCRRAARIKTTSPGSPRRAGTGLEQPKRRDPVRRSAVAGGPDQRD